MIQDGLLALGVIGVAMLIVGLGRPRGTVGFCLICGSALAPMTAVRVTSSLTVADVLLDVGCVLALLMRRPKLQAPTKAVLRAIAVVSLGGLIGTFWTPTPLASIAMIARFAVGTGVPLVAIGAWHPTRRQLGRCAAAFGLGVVISVAAGLAGVGGTNWGRAEGLSTQPNLFGVTCAIGFGVWLALAGRRHRLIGLVGAGICLVGVLISGSRSALIGVVACWVVYLVISRDRRIRFRTLLLAGVVAVLLGSGTVHLPATSALNRLLTPDSDVSAGLASQGRASARDESITEIHKYPITGHGFSDERVAQIGTHLPTIQRAHSIVLAIWESAGLVGLVGLFLLSRQTWRVALAARGDRFAAGLIASFVGFLAFDLISDQLWERFIWLALAMAIEAVRLTRAELSTGDHDHDTGSAVAARARR